jgi:hypothetical protein
MWCPVFTGLAAATISSSITGKWLETDPKKHVTIVTDANNDRPNSISSDAALPAKRSKKLRHWRC